MFGLEQLVIDFLRNEWLVAFALGFLPISEVRGAVIYALSVGRPELVLVGAFANVLAAPAILAIWKIVNIPWWGRLILGKSLDDKIRSFTRENEKWGFFALAVFIGIPLPVTGVYTGTLVGRLVGMKRRWIIAASIVGVVISGVITFAVVSGVLSGLRML
ncbi:MAG: small multi-drug export protein [Candidatus Micrarchaeota archaeon]